MKIKAKINQYTKNGAIIFVYTLIGTIEELEAYKASQGVNYRENELNEPLYFSQRICEVNADLTLTRSGRYMVLQDLEQKATQLDTATTSALGKLNAIAQYCGLSKLQLQEKLIASF